MKNYIKLFLLLLLTTQISFAQWVQQNSGTTIDLYDVSFTDDNNGTAVGGYWGEGIILRTTNGGTTWTPQSSGITNPLFDVCFTSTNNGTAVGGYGIVLRTTNGGTTWTPQSSGTSNHLSGVSFINSNVGIAVGDEGTIRRTTNGGATWIPQSSNITNDLLGICLVNSNVGIAVGQGGTILRTTNGGTTWTSQSTGNNDRLWDVTFTNVNNGIISGDSYNDLGLILRTTNEGSTWTSQTFGSAPFYLYGNDFSDINNGIVVGLYGTILRTTNGGTTWTSESSVTTERLLGISKPDNYHAWAVGVGGTIIKYNLTPVIFIPGAMGSPLYDNVNPNDQHLSENERIWIKVGATLDVLQLASNGFDPLNPSYNIQVAPLRNDVQNNVKHNLQYQYSSLRMPLSVYKNFFEGLINSSAHYILDDGDDNTQLGENLFCFVYDWRKSITYNAGKLSDYIDFVKSYTGANQVNLITHSMGGLVAKQCIKEYSWGRIKKLLFIGTPHLGSPNIYYTLLTGDLLGILTLVYNSEDIMKISLNMPSGYQLFPSQKYFDVSINNGVSSRVDLYNFGFWSVQGNPLNYSSTQQYFKDVDLPNGWRFNNVLLDQAQSYQSNSLNVDYGPIEIYNIVTWGIPTIGEVRDFMLGVSHIPNREYSLWGDGTVPLRSAEIVSINKKKADYYFADVKHMDLPSNSQVVSTILDLLKEPAITNFNNPPSTYAVNPIYQITAGSPVELHTYDSQNRHTGSTSDSTWEDNIPDSWYFANNLQDTSSSKVIIVTKGDYFTIKILSQNATSNFDLSIKDIIDGQNRLEVQYASVPIFPNTISICDFDTLTEILELKMDFDGDGNIDSIITPTNFLMEVKGDGNDEQIINYLLEQNYPNPFNPNTVVRYQVPWPGFVSLKVYDVLGNEIEILVNEEKTTGSYEVTWYPENLPSGIYFYQLKAGNFIGTKKMILLK